MIGAFVQIADAIQRVGLHAAIVQLFLDGQRGAIRIERRTGLPLARENAAEIKKRVGFVRFIVEFLLDDHRLPVAILRSGKIAFRFVGVA